MSAVKQSLRLVVNKWIAARSEGNVRLTRSPHAQSGAGRFVCVEVTQKDRPFAIIFFRHEDGSWQVFPPPARRPMLNIG
jgi:hypothetical protein